LVPGVEGKRERPTRRKAAYKNLGLGEQVTRLDQSSSGRLRKTVEDAKERPSEAEDGE